MEFGIGSLVGVVVGITLGFILGRVTTKPVARDWTRDEILDAWKVLATPFTDAACEVWGSHPEAIESYMATVMRSSPDLERKKPHDDPGLQAIIAWALMRSTFVSAAPGLLRRVMAQRYLLTDEEIASFEEDSSE